MIRNKRAKIKQEWKNIIFNLIFAILSLLIVMIFYKTIWLTTILLIILSIIGLIRWKSNLTSVMFIFGALFGGAAEIFAITSGVCKYSVYNIINIPFWLFIIWGNAASFLYQTSLEIKKLGIKK